MEVYKDSTTTLKLNIGEDADGDNVTLTITRLSDDEIILNGVSTNKDSTGVYSYTLDEDETGVLGEYKKVWSYAINTDSKTKTSYFTIVVGYATPGEIKVAFPELVSATDAELQRKEQLARKMINIFCNQIFDVEEGTTKIIQGNASDFLPLPRRMWQLDTVKINGTDDITTSVELNSKFYVRKKSTIPPVDIKRDVFGGPYFKSNVYYHLAGNWGWRFVPEEIKMATKILVADYFNDDTLLRQHGVVSAQFGDLSYKFAGDLWATTGNYDVDLLIAPYKNTNFTVI